ncbi:transmembrane alanine and valine and leucine rich domain protein [Mycobacterium avium subsp. avium 2285 (R)]|nr:transmembrane alanine and valine and leucine rich domain protein [Mycobacterium avium subsp. avium 2285 (R)]
MSTVLLVLAAATALADRDPAGACVYLGSARRHAARLRSGDGGDREPHVALADAVGACVDDLQRVIDLRPG